MSLTPEEIRARGREVYNGERETHMSFGESKELADELERLQRDWPDTGCTASKNGPACESCVSCLRGTLSTYKEALEAAEKAMEEIESAAWKVQDWDGTRVGGALMQVEAALTQVRKAQGKEKEI